MLFRSENQRRLIELEVRAEELSLRENLAELSAQTDKVEQARSKLEIAQVRYQRGIADNLDVTDAHAHFFSHGFFKGLLSLRPGRGPARDDAHV